MTGNNYRNRSGRSAHLVVCGVCAALALSLFLSCGSKTEEKNDTVVLSAPFGPLAYPFVFMAEQDGPGGYELTVWKNPDQLRAMIVGKQADFFALPTNVAALFHTKGADVSLLNVSVWSVLWIVSTDSTKTSLEDFRGEELLMPFRGDMPHILFTTLARGCGIDPERDLKLAYVGTPQDAVQHLLLGKARHAVLCEPDLSILMFRAGKGTPESSAPLIFYRTVDLQEEWDHQFHSGRAIPIGGVAIGDRAKDNAALVTSFSEAYTKAVVWCVGHPEETAAMVSAYFDGIPPEPIAEAIRHVNQHVESARDAKEKLGAFFDVLMKSDPATLGGALPDDSFYFGGVNEIR